MLSPPYSTLTYTIPKWFPEEMTARGLRVAVPLGKKGLRCAVILEVDPPVDAQLAGLKLRPIWWPLERKPLLAERYLELVEHLARFQMVTPGRVLGAVLPQRLKEAQVQVRVMGSESGALPQSISLGELVGLTEEQLLELRCSWLAGLADIREKSEENQDRDIYAIAVDPPWPIRPQAKRQLEILECLWDKGALSGRQLSRQLGQMHGDVLRGLIKKGLVRVEVTPDEGEYCRDSDLELPPELPKELFGQDDAARAFEFSVEQRAALMKLEELLNAASAEARTALLHGVTGSGKTAVYLELAEKCLAAGRSVLILAPEVALAWKLLREAKAYLPEACLYFSHGYQTPLARFRTFSSVARRNEDSRPCLVVGTRSSLFLPLPRLGLIILDEEHDDSYKQDEGLIYQAKDLAYFRAMQDGSLLILGSATPDVRTYQAARQENISLCELPKRISGAALPELRFVDISGLDPQQGVLSPTTLETLRTVVERGEQAVIMLNRRGYAPLMYCLACKTVLKCPQCDIGLTFHKGRERLVCHYCGHTAAFPTPCSSCGSLHYLSMAEGTEKLEESLGTFLGRRGRVLRLDRDTTRRPGRLEEILAAFARQEADILVGTQMLSKGHHFPNVTLAVVADADLGLNLPDYRAAERTFQLLLQSAGRAGRGEKPGQVIIQTRMPDNPCWKYLAATDYAGFFELEIGKRKQRGYPPYVRLALIRMSFPRQWAGGVKALSGLSAVIKAKAAELGITVLGPAPAPLSVLRGQKRYQCLLKAASWPQVRQLYNAVLNHVPAGSQLRLSLDLDPVNLL